MDEKETLCQGCGSKCSYVEEGGRTIFVCGSMLYPDGQFTEAIGCVHNRLTDSRDEVAWLKKQKKRATYFKEFAVAVAQSLGASSVPVDDKKLVGSAARRLHDLITSFKESEAKLSSARGLLMEMVAESERWVLFEDGRLEVANVVKWESLIAAVPEEEEDNHAD